MGFRHTLPEASPNNRAIPLSKKFCLPTEWSSLVGRKLSFVSSAEWSAWASDRKQKYILFHSAFDWVISQWKKSNISCTSDLYLEWRLSRANPDFQRDHSLFTSQKAVTKYCPAGQRPISVTTSRSRDQSWPSFRASRREWTAIINMLSITDHNPLSIQ